MDSRGPVYLPCMRPHSPPLVEVCIDSVACAGAAERGGAGRVELCADLVRGGTTPSAGMIERTCRHVSIPVVALIRPRAGDFLYDDLEVEVMLHDIAAAASLGAAGIATGALTADARIDAERLRPLIDAARPMSVTFHRAFDHTRDPMEALEALMSLGVDRLLTSGGAPTALAGRETLARLVARAGSDLVIMAGGGVTAESAPLLAKEAGVREVHVRAAEPVESAMVARTPNVTFGKPYVPDEYRWPAVREDKVREVVDALRGER